MLLLLGQRVEQALGELVGAPVEPGPLGQPLFVSRASLLRRSAGLGTTVTRPACGEGSHQPGEVAGVEGEPGTQGAQLAARGPDLPEQASLVGVQPAAEEVVGEDTDVLGDGAVEAAYVAQERGHSLTIVRDHDSGQSPSRLASPEARCTLRATAARTDSSVPMTETFSLARVTAV